MPLQKSNLNGLYPNLPYEQVLFDGGRHLFFLQGHEVSLDGLFGVGKGFIDRLTLRVTSRKRRNFGPVAAFFRLVYQNRIFQDPSPLQERDKLVIIQPGLFYGRLEKAYLQIAGDGNGDDLTVWHLDINVIAFAAAHNSARLDKGFDGVFATHTPKLAHNKSTFELPKTRLNL